jgi:holliday junction DNA helicase RuvA
MIGSLRGTLTDRTLTGEVLVEVTGVGYRVVVSPSTAIAIGEVGDEVYLYVHHHIREDNQTLYGFPSRDERIAFEALLGAHGVGPALALAILSVHPPAALARVLADDDLAALCLVPGVGKKTAARLLVELKSRLDIPDLDAAGAPGGGPNGHGGSPRSDVHDALAGLGYGPDEIRDAVRDLPVDGDASTLLREALRRLAGAR